MKPIEGKIIVFCAALRGKKEKVIFLLLKTHKEDKLEFFLGQLFGCYNHRELKIFSVEDLATGFCSEVVFVPFIIVD